MSIISHRYSYGGNEGLFEIAVLKGDQKDHQLCYDTKITNDVIGRLTEKQVNNYVLKISKL